MSVSSSSLTTTTSQADWVNQQFTRWKQVKSLISDDFDWLVKHNLPVKKYFEFLQDDEDEAGLFHFVSTLLREGSELHSQALN